MEIDYRPKVFGIKLQKNFFAVEEANLFDDISKYDFLLKDSLTESYNGNTSYRADVMVETGKRAIINGWELTTLLFPGCWSGQNVRFVLVDALGCEYKSPEPVLKKWIWYNLQPVVVIREALQAVLDFTNENLSVKYNHIISGIDVPHKNLTKEEYHKFIDRVESYIKDYQELMQTNEMMGMPEKAENIKVLFDKQIRKCFPFGLDIQIE